MGLTGEKWEEKEDTAWSALSHLPSGQYKKAKKEKKKNKKAKKEEKERKDGYEYRGERQSFRKLNICFFWDFHFQALNLQMQSVDLPSKHFK